MTIPPLPWENIGLVGFIVFIGWMMVTGKLVAKAAHEREMKWRDDRVSYLETTMSAMQETKAEVIRQNGELLPTAQLSIRLLEAGRIGLQNPEEST